MLRRVLALGFAAVTAGCMHGPSGADGGSRVRFEIEDLTPDQARSFRVWTGAALAKVDAWWGTPFGGQFIVKVSNSYRISKALVPAWRGERGDMEVPASRVRDGMAAMVHELTHVTAPNSNRFLAEGLATYAQEHLKGVPAFPNFGEDLHQAAKALLPDWTVGDVVRLERIPTPTRLRIENKLDEQQSYILAGSFLRWLIDTRGEQSLRALYALTPLIVFERIPGAPGRWAKAYQEGFAGLVGRWRAFLEGLAKAAADDGRPARIGRRWAGKTGAGTRVAKTEASGDR